MQESQVCSCTGSSKNSSANTDLLTSVRQYVPPSAPILSDSYADKHPCQAVYEFGPSLLGPCPASTGG